MLKRVWSSILGLLLFAMVITAGCSGGGSSAPGPQPGPLPGGGTGLTISGVVTDVTGINQPAAGVTVTLRKADHSTIDTTTSASNGTYSFTNVPASSDVYINVSKANYASFNTEILTLTSNLSGKELDIATATAMKTWVDTMYGSAGGASWSDPFYSGKGWIGMDLMDVSGNPVPGITVTAAPSGPTMVYNNGSDVFTSTPPTVGWINSSLLGGYNATQGVYTFTTTKASTTQTVKLPLVPGEITYYWTKSWGQGVTISGVLTDTSGSSTVPVAGLQVTARHPSDIDNSNFIAQATTAANGAFSLTVPSGSDLYLNISGTATGGTQYTSMNFSIWRNVIAAPDLTKEGVGTLPLSSFNSFLNSATCGGSPCSTSGGWLAVDTYDAATMQNNIAGISLVFSPSLAFFGYNNNTTNGTTFIAPPTQMATLADTTSAGWNGPSAWANNATPVIATVTASKSGSMNQTYELPIVPGQLTYKQVGF